MNDQKNHDGTDFIACIGGRFRATKPLIQGYASPHFIISLTFPSYLFLEQPWSSDFEGYMAITNIL